MRKLNFLMLLLMTMTLGLGVNAQDTIRHLIITEARFDSHLHAYIELTNMSETETVDLSEFSYALLRDHNYEMRLNGNVVEMVEGQTLWASSYMPLEGTLAPGESYLIMNTQDAMNGAYSHRPTPIHSIDMVVNRADTVIHFADWNGGDNRYRTYPLIPEWEMWGKDTVSWHKDGSAICWNVFFHRFFEGGALIWHSGDTIQVMVDQVLGEIDWTLDRPSIYGGEKLASTAGVEAAHIDNILVRKFSVKEGQTNWALASGVTPETSEWMLIPSNDMLNHMCFETEGYHGDFHISVSSDVYDINEAESKITVPWGTEKGDSIRLGLNLGLGMAWQYLENGILEDSLSTICQTGDTLVLFACGNELETKKYVIEVAPPTNDMAYAFAKHRMNYPNPDDEDYDPLEVASVGNVPYLVEEHMNEMDSIIGVAFATKIDTLMKFIEVAPNASWEIVFKSGEVSNEVSDGDILKVTAENGTTIQEYYIVVEDYMESDNVDLRAITWPDKTGFMEGWMGDTIPLFKPNTTQYTIMLNPGTKNVPALLAETDDPNATLVEMRAISLSGGINERTTTFTVTSESDTTERVIKVLFNVINPDPQLYIGDPIFSKFYMRDWWGAGGMEICNPTDELIDMSNYMIVQSNATNPAEAITGGWALDSVNWAKRYKKLVPGYKWQTFSNWAIEPGILEFDASVNPYVDPKDVMAFWKIHPRVDQAWTSNLDDLIPRIDHFINGQIAKSEDPTEWKNPWGEPLDENATIAMPLWPTGAVSQYNYYIFKILNDSIKLGTKAATDPLDFELVDAFGDVTAPWVVDGRDQSSRGECWRFERYPQYYTGVKTLGEAFSPVEGSHYQLKNGIDDQPEFSRDVWQQDMGSHALDPITAHLSTVSSLVYKVSAGYQGIQTATGVSNSETMDDFFANLIKATPDQTLAVHSAADGSALAGTDAVAEGDTLLVTSADGNTVTKYVISIVPLDDNAVLTAKDGSGLSIEVNGATGTVGGFTFGTTLRSVLGNVEVPATAVLNIVNSDDELVQLQRKNTDSVYVDLVASSMHYFEVIAENGDMIKYQLSPVTAASDAYVLSDVYEVTEDPTKVVSNIVEGIAVQAFFDNLIPAKGATLKIQKVSGQERTEGRVSVDDILIVTSEDASVTVSYSLNFFGEYSAYVTSETFEVNQSTMIIKVEENTTVEALIAGLVVAPEATFVVMDLDGNEKTTGTVLGTDVVVVYAGDGFNMVSYTIEILVSVYGSISDELKVYPNPATSILYVENTPAGSTLRVIDITGRTQMVKQSDEISGGLGISDLRNGMYFLTIEKDGKSLASVKFIKE